MKFSPFLVDDDDLPSVDLPELPAPTPEARLILAAHRRALGQDKPPLPPRGTNARAIVEAGRRIGVCW